MKHFYNLYLAPSCSISTTPIIHLRRACLASSVIIFAVVARAKNLVESSYSALRVNLKLNLTDDGMKEGLSARNFLFFRNESLRLL